MNFDGFDFDDNIKQTFNTLDIQGRVPHAVVIESRDSEKAMNLAVFLSMYAVCTEPVKPCGHCEQCHKALNKTVSDEELAYPLKPLIRIATENDLRHLEENKLKEKEAYRICEQKIANHKLEMKLVSVECTFDNSKILFYFTADGRVDFRALVKDLASVFRTRIELRQIGVRDEAKMLGGLGVCGKPFCCASFMGEFQPVSISYRFSTDTILLADFSKQIGAKKCVDLGTGCGTIPLLWYKTTTALISQR